MKDPNHLRKFSRLSTWFLMVDYEVKFIIFYKFSPFKIIDGISHDFIHRAITLKVCRKFSTKNFKHSSLCRNRWTI